MDVDCEKNCQAVKEDHYEWEISIPNFNYKDNTEHGQKGRKFFIKGNILKSSMSYDITVRLKNDYPRKGKAIFKINVAPDPEYKITEECQIVPPEGNGMETDFRLNCKNFGYRAFFELYHEGNLVSTGFTHEMLYKTFKLPTGRFFL